MRVALVSRAVFPLHGYGGLERHVAALEKYLRRSGVDVTLYTSPPERERDMEQAPSGTREGTARVHVYVPYRIVPWPKRGGFVVLDRDTNYLAWSVRAARRLLEDEPVDVVQADGGGGFGYALLAGAERAPLLLHPHGMEEFKAPALKRALYLPLRSATRFAARKAASVLAPDAAMKEEVLRTLDLPEEKVVVVPNAIDLDQVDREVPGIDLSRFGIPADSRVFLSVSRLESNKGFTVLVRALGRARSRLPPGLLWVLVGEGPERRRIEEEIEREGIGGIARLTGRMTDDELHLLYRRAELFLHPTLYEGSSMVTLEAMAHRKPVVATGVGGIPDKVVPGESGLLVPPADVEALADAVVEASRDGDRLAAWGAEGRRVVEARFSWSRRIQEVLRLYERLARKRESGTPRR
jgi:glycosyltransferase involved in cell wall biosynthesis